MKAPAFWYEAPGLLARSLLPLAWVYEGASEVQAWLRSRCVYYAGVPVISVGNITVGGSGKTPLVAALARHYAAHGHQVAVVLRGHGGSEIAWPQEVNASHTPVRVGDEAVMLTRMLKGVSANVWVGRCRRDVVRRAEQAGATLIILDDAFHRHDISRKVDIVVIDGPRGFGNGMVMPAGPLREPLEHLNRASFGVVMDEPEDKANSWHGLPAYRLRLRPDEQKLAELRGKHLVAFAGIGNPDKFFDMLKRQGLQVREAVAFGDHHAYSKHDREGLAKLAAEHQAMLVTTAKDAVKLPDGFAQVVEIEACGADWRALLMDLDGRLAG